MNDLVEAIRAYMNTPDFSTKYPEGATPGEILVEVQEANPNEFLLCSPIDVSDELINIYGRPSR